MASAKRTSKKSTVLAHVPNDSSMIHTFLGASIGLLLFISAAQFILLRVVWEEVIALRDQSQGVEEQISEDQVAVKQVVVPVATQDYRAWIPQNFSFRVEENYSVISAKGVYAVIYKDSETAPVYFGPQINPYVLLETRKSSAGIDVDTLAMQIWITPEISSENEIVSQLQNVISSIELIPFSM